MPNLTKRLLCPNLHLHEPPLGPQVSRAMLLVWLVLSLRLYRFENAFNPLLGLAFRVKAWQQSNE